MIFGIRVLLYPFSNFARVELQLLSTSDPPKLVRHRQPPGLPHRAEETFGEKGLYLLCWYQYQTSMLIK